MTIKKCLVFMSYLSMSLVLVVILVVFFWELYPYKTVQFGQPFKVLTPLVKQGDQLLISIDYCKFSSAIPLVTRHFVDGLIYDTEPQAATSKSTGCGNVTVSIDVPKALPAGVYYVKSTYEYKVNPLRTIDVNTVTEKFTVTK